MSVVNQLASPLWTNEDHGIEMKEFVKNQTIEMAFSKFSAKMYVKNLHKLERWK